MTFVLPFFLLAALFVFLLVEKLINQSAVRSFSVRIHVNGTRGKSTVTRYIAAALRAAGYRTFAKITGVRPTIIDPDGKNILFRRRGPAHIREQLRMIRLARKHSCEALVLECMSVAPPLQEMESEFLRPHLTILTNIRDDHREELGKTERERLEAYSSSLPLNATLITSGAEYLPVIERAAREKNTNVILASPEDSITTEDVSFPVMAEAVALALTACRNLGIEKPIAIQAILEEVKKENSPLFEMKMGDHRVCFINGFAVNDVPSAITFIEMWKGTISDLCHRVIVLNTRADRPLRSLEFAKWCSREKDLISVVLIGSHVPYTFRAMMKEGFPTDQLYRWSEQEILSPWESLQKIVTGHTAVFGFGNIAGDGFRLLDALTNIPQKTLLRS